MEDGGFFGGGGREEEGGLRGEEGGGGGEACWILGGGSVVFVVGVGVGVRHDGGMVSAKSDRMDISGPDLFFLSFVSLVPPQRVSATTTTTARFSDGCSKILICPSPFFPERRKTRADGAGCCLFCMLVVDVVDGVSVVWLASRQLEKNPFNKMYSTVLLPPVYNK